MTFGMRLCNTKNIIVREATKIGHKISTDQITLEVALLADIGLHVYVYIDKANSPTRPTSSNLLSSVA